MKEFNNFLKSLSQSFQAFTQLVEKMNQKLEMVSEPKAQPAAPPKKKERAVSVKKAPARRISAKKAAAEPARAAEVKKAVKKPTRARRVKPEAGTTILEAVQIAIESNPGIDIKTLQEKTGFETRQIQNTIFRLKKTGDIKTAGRGVYYPAGITEPEQPVEEQPVPETEPAEV